MILLLAKWKLNFSRRAANFAELSLYLKYSLCPESHHPNQFHVRQFAKLNKIFQIILEVLKTNAFFWGDDSWMCFFERHLVLLSSWNFIQIYSFTHHHRGKVSVASSVLHFFLLCLPSVTRSLKACLDSVGWRNPIIEVANT